MICLASRTERRLIAVVTGEHDHLLSRVGVSTDAHVATCVPDRAITRGRLPIAVGLHRGGDQAVVADIPTRSPWKRCRFPQNTPVTAPVPIEGSGAPTHDTRGTT